ncbi:hypothetical protein RSOLAG1IB_01699 [Rhizoctonia solani AG-1 IB]|uniref:Uncharacterized protein n=1 Tax=Thanatephorus cucumeris (strain AG1-IB / isolate 7/3/14) TaxID=1108050 RepID=A0A0B7FHP5_THACB|nr:hypothetical protein RSOLAG1IB_01699 [Rhizoctonia solani AG-1 IB]
MRTDLLILLALTLVLPVLYAAPAREALLQECRSGGSASCTFLSPKLAGVYSQRALLGNPFSNCLSTQRVKHTLSGSTTITDSWSVSPELSTEWKLGIPTAELAVITTISQSRAVTVTQSIEFDIPPNMQTALIAVAKFQGLSGKMLLKYSNHTSVNISNTFYFQYNEEPVVFQRLDLSCDEDWPAWEIDKPAANSGTLATHNSTRTLWGIVACLIWALWI